MLLIHSVRSLIKRVRYSWSSHLSSCQTTPRLSSHGTVNVLHFVCKSSVYHSQYVILFIRMWRRVGQRTVSISHVLIYIQFSRKGRLVANGNLTDVLNESVLLIFPSVPPGYISIPYKPPSVLPHTSSTHHHCRSQASSHKLRLSLT